MPADLGRLYEGLCDVGDHADLYQLQQPKGNANTELLIRTLKEELLWLREWTSPLELEQALVTWIE